MFDHALSFFVVIAPTLFALVLEIVDEKIRKHRFWRYGVVAFGVIISGATWWQMSRQEASASIAQESAIERVASETSRQVTKTVGEEYQQMITDLTMQIQGLKDQLVAQAKSFTNQLKQTDTDLSGSISKVGVAPTKYAKLQFRFWGIGDLPILNEYAHPDSDSVISVDFTVTNISDTAANSVDMWIYICDQCTFATEPAGFDRPTGMPDVARHRLFPTLNPGVSLEKMTVKIKLPAFPFNQSLNSEIALKYSCATCGKISEDVQSLKITAMRPVPLASP